MVDRLWSELGTTMRRTRDEAGVSLRELELRGTWRRSTISQVETGKARPSRRLVEWYDAELGTDGLLLSIYAEARSRQLLHADEDDVVDEGPTVATDAVTVVDVDPPTGLLVPRAARLQARFTLLNSGTTRWTDRRLHRMGAYAGARLVGSAPFEPVPDAEPGATVEVVATLHAPELLGTAVAYWQLTTAEDVASAPQCPPAAVLLVVG